MYTTYKFRIKPNKEQAKSLSDWTNCSRFVYNKYLEKNINRYNKEKKFFSYVDSNNSLVQLKKENDFLKEVPSQVLQQKVQQLSGNIQKVWKQGFGFPKFKKRYKDESGICFPQGFKVNGRKLKLPKLKTHINIILHRELIGEIKSITIKKDYDNKFFACFILKIDEVEKIRNPKTSIGLDVGLKTFLVGSDGSQIKNHKFRKNTEKKIRKKQRNISKKKKGSNNRRKVIKKLRRIYEKEFNRKKDFINKTSNQITNDYDIICIEDLNIKGMVKNHCLAKSIQDVSWGEFFRTLEWQCKKKGKYLVKINRFFPSSKLCSNCGYKKSNKELTLKDRIYHCPECGNKIDRDFNASLNILRQGLSDFKPVEKA